MNSYYSRHELLEIGFGEVGENVLISRKASIYGAGMMSFGNNVRVDDFCFLSGKLVFGSNITITSYCLLHGGKEGIYFEDFSSIAWKVNAFTTSDDYSGATLTNPTVPDMYRTNMTSLPLYIKRHAIVGASSTIMPGAHIEEGVSVGAHSLVTKPTEAWGIYFGVPAKRVKDRKKDLLELEKTYLEELANSRNP